MRKFDMKPLLILDCKNQHYKIYIFNAFFNLNNCGESSPEMAPKMINRATGVSISPAVLGNVESVFFTEEVL